MTFKVIIHIGGQLQDWSPSSLHRITVREDDTVQFQIVGGQVTSPPIIFVEDFEVTVEADAAGEGMGVFVTAAKPIFRESFGSAAARIVVGEYTVIVPFEVFARKLTSQRVESMLQYLSQQSEDLWRVCLSRSTLKAGVHVEGYADPETLLSTAEQLVARLIDCQSEIQYQLRQRLVPRRVPGWEATGWHADIDPYDIVTNLDALQPTVGYGDVVLNGRTYSVSGVAVNALEHTVDVDENAVLIGGVYSIRRVLTQFLDQLNQGFSTFGLASHDKEYESLGDVLARVTTGGMRRRAETVLDAANNLIRFFERRLGLVYRGELKPRITPYVRSTRIYRVLFDHLHQWYSLGMPSFTGLQFLVKLRSLSKIYEFYCLFRILEVLLDLGWDICTVRMVAGTNDQVPEWVSLAKEDLKLTLFYEPKILPYGPGTNHLDLVDVHHTGNTDYSMWTPDFVLRVEAARDVMYGVLDAKYSSQWTVRNRCIPDLTDKYYNKTAVYDAVLGCLDGGRIIAVYALYPGAEYEQDYFSDSSRHGLNARIPKLPVLAGITASPEQQTGLPFALKRFLDLSEHRFNMRAVA